MKKKGVMLKQDLAFRRNEMQRMKTQTHPRHKGLKISNRKA